MSVLSVISSDPSTFVIASVLNDSSDSSLCFEYMTSSEASVFNDSIVMPMFSLTRGEANVFSDRSDAGDFSDRSDHQQPMFSVKQ